MGSTERLSDALEITEQFTDVELLAKEIERD